MPRPASAGQARSTSRADGSPPAARRLPTAPTARTLGARPIVARTPVIEVAELDGRDAAYVALLELAIADDEWEQDELTQAYSPTREKRGAKRDAEEDRLEEMLDELAAVAISEDWDEDPITKRYALPLPPQVAVNGAATAMAGGAAQAPSGAASPSPTAARRASSWQPTSKLPPAWRAWR